MQNLAPGAAALAAFTKDLAVIPTYYPGIQALWHKVPAERIPRVNQQADAYQQLTAVLAWSRT
ncbi:hypothetical protein [Cryobacterium aureum]|uniref:hypothetical protein n=1 Tax=Cryobacterium aureum TaxID=995037 RepID=UPI000CF4DFB5|nr:hypothetical protein [Cryobacterium aureum]